MGTREYLETSRGLAVGVLAASPLLAAYEAGVLLSGAGIRNGADALARGLFVTAFGPAGNRVFVALVALALATAAAFAVRQGIAAHRLAAPIAAEGVVYAALLGPAALLLRERFGAIALDLAADAGPSTTLLRGVLSAGAGVYEELVFRGLLLSGLYAAALRIGGWFGTGKGFALGASILLSSLAFAAFHHVGPFGSPFDADVFAFRSVAGALLGSLFVVRGIGVAIYTHAAYDALLVVAG